MSGVRAEVRIRTPPACTAAAVSDATHADVTRIRKATPSAFAGTVTEELVLDSPVSLDGVEVGGGEQELEEVFSYEGRRAYRFERSRQRCPCHCIEQYAGPVLDVYAHDGWLVVVFHAPDSETLHDVVGALNDGWRDVTVHRLVSSADGSEGEELVLVDRSELTDRQREILETAHEMGYFDHPRGANAEEVAAELGINGSTFVEHLSAAQRKLMATLLDDAGD